MKNHYKLIEYRAEVRELRLPELVAEFASLKSGETWSGTDRERHARLGRVVDELRRRGALD